MKNDGFVWRKYGDNVRAIKFGSMELCGGIHVNNTADIWSFKIVSEGAVAAEFVVLKLSQVMELKISQLKKNY
jgi:alanyl-tRNA synthetase